MTKKWDVTLGIPRTFRVIAETGDDAVRLAWSLDPLTDSRMPENMPQKVYVHEVTEVTEE